jgi:hypothetical protein
MSVPLLRPSQGHHRPLVAAKPAANQAEPPPFIAVAIAALASRVVCWQVPLVAVSQLFMT